MSWWQRARRRELPSSVVNGSPRRQWPCPDCDFRDADVEVTWAHLWATHHDRRRLPRVAA